MEAGRETESATVCLVGPISDAPNFVITAVISHLFGISGIQEKSMMVTPRSVLGSSGFR